MNGFAAASTTFIAWPERMDYILNLSRMKEDYPGWGITKNLSDVFSEIHAAWLARAE